MSELLYAGKSLAEVAGYDLRQLRLVICRPRDANGRLVRGGERLPPWVEVDAEGQRVVSNPVPFQEAFYQVQARAGRNRAQAADAWLDWRLRNPRFGRPPGDN